MAAGLFASILCLHGLALSSAHYYDGPCTGSTPKWLCHENVSEEQRRRNKETVAVFSETKRQLLSTNNRTEARRRLNTAATRFPDIMKDSGTFNQYLTWFDQFTGGRDTCLDIGTWDKGCMLNYVAVHVVKEKGCTSTACGHVDLSSIKAQIRQLNIAFSGMDISSRRTRNNVNQWSSVQSATDTGMRFKLHSVNYWENDEWFRCSNGMCSTYMREMRYATAVRPEVILNVWFHNVPSAIGFVTQYSWDSVDYEANPMLGPAVHSPTVSGTAAHQYYNQGDVLTHEVGHYFGVMHPYDGGCNSDVFSDGIEDTPRMSSNIKPTCAQINQNLDSCDANNNPEHESGLNEGEDLIDNFMVITEDACRWYFTPGQADVMHAITVRYRPTLIKLGHPRYPEVSPGCVTAVDSTDLAPDMHPCWFGEWQLAVEQVNAANSFVYAGTRYTRDHGPILDKPPPGRTEMDGRGWCFTGPEMVNWGYACCPHSRPNDNCDSATTDADFSWPTVDRTAVPNPPAQDDSPAQDEPPVRDQGSSDSTPNENEGSPDDPPEEDEDTSPPELICYADGGSKPSSKKRSRWKRCQLPFTYYNKRAGTYTTYTEPLPIATTPPLFMPKKPKNPRDSSTRTQYWCPYKLKRYGGHANVYGYGKKGTGARKNWGYANCNYWPSDPQAHHYERVENVKFKDGAAVTGISCSGCDSLEVCERHCDMFDSCTAYEYSYDDTQSPQCKHYSETTATSSNTETSDDWEIHLKGSVIWLNNMLSAGGGHDTAYYFTEEEYLLEGGNSEKGNTEKSIRRWYEYEYFPYSTEYEIEKAADAAVAALSEQTPAAKLSTSGSNGASYVGIGIAVGVAAFAVFALGVGVVFKRMHWGNPNDPHAIGSIPSRGVPKKISQEDVDDGSVDLGVSLRKLPETPVDDEAQAAVVQV